MKKILKFGFLCGIAILPNAMKIFFYNKLFGWGIDKTAKIGWSYINCKQVKIAANVKIGHFNVIRNLEIFDVGQNSIIGHLNKASALPIGSNFHFQDETDRVQALIIGQNSAIVKGHFFDCNNKIEIGDFTIIAGFGSAFFTHSINVMNNKQETKFIKIGDYCMVGAKSVITRGAVLPDYSILASNSTLHKPFDQTHRIYSGVPAMSVKELDPACEYFHRKDGFVG